MSSLGGTTLKRLTDMWKANNINNYPTKKKKLVANDNQATTRGITKGKLVQVGLSLMFKSFIGSFHIYNCKY